MTENNSSPTNNDSPEHHPFGARQKNSIPFQGETFSIQEKNSLTRKKLPPISPPENVPLQDKNPLFERATPEKVSNNSFSSDNPFSNSPALPKVDFAKVGKDNVKGVELEKFTRKPTILKESGVFAILTIVLTYIITDIQKKPRSFKIGLFSIFIVVGFLVVMQSALQVSAIVFLKISENQVSDADLILTPIPATNDSRLQDGSFNSNPLNSLRLLDGQFLEDLCDKSDDIVGCSPRWILFGDASKPQEKEKLRVYILAFDSLKEQSIGLGRNLIAPDLKDNECYLTLSTVKSLDLTDQVYLKMDIITTLISQGFLTLSNSTNSNTTTEKQVADFKDSLKSLLRGALGIANFSSTTANTSVIKENAKDLNEAIKNSGLPLNRPLSDFPAISNALMNTFNVPKDFMETLNLRNVTEFLDTFDTLQNNVTITPNETLEALLDAVIEALNLTSTFQIKANISSPNGKWPESLGNVLAFDYQFIPSLITNSIEEAFKVSNNEFVRNLALNQQGKDIIREVVKSLDIKKFTVSENFVIKDRMKVYTDQNTMDGYFIQMTNKYFKAMGKDVSVSASIPLAQTMQGVLIIKSFLDNIFTSAVFILIMLSMLLIYSLMLSNIDEKTYEFGMLRALGFKSRSLIILLLLQGLMYAIPAMIFGFLFSFIVNGMIGYLIFNWAAEITSYQLHYTAIIIGFLLGILMPLLSNILPIMRALSKTLRDSLDLYHRTVNAFAVRIMKLEKLGISFSQFINAISLIIIGITTYYFAPLAFVKQNIALFLAIMNIVLIFLIIGFTLFINLLQTPFEKLLLYIILCGKDRKLRPLILKNMTAHSKRNAKTALMFTICLAFLIFSGTGFSLQTNVLENSLKVTMGSDITVMDMSNGLDEANLRQFLEDYKKQYPGNINEYTFVTFPFDSLPAVSTPTLSPLSGFPSRNCKILGIEENYLKSAFTEFYLPTEYDPTMSYPELPDGQKDGFYGLFTLQGTETLSLDIDPLKILSKTDQKRNDSNGLNETLLVAIPEGARSGLAIDTLTPGVLTFGDRVYKVRVRNMARKVPGFGLFFSSYQTVISTLYAAMSMRQMRRLLEAEWKFDEYGNKTQQIEEFYSKSPKNLTYGITKQRLLVKFARPLSWLERTELSNGLRNYFLSDLTLLFDMTSLVETSQQAFFFINLFYIIVALISIILSFFLILVSFMSNVKENSWEFGVLRAIGLSKSQMTRLYMYEAGVLTASSGILGSIVGIVVAITLILQLLLFTELPFVFLFPTEIFCITFFLGLGTAVIGSYYAVKEIREKSIANITKGLL